MYLSSIFPGPRDQSQDAYPHELFEDTCKYLAERNKIKDYKLYSKPPAETKTLTNHHGRPRPAMQTGKSVKSGRE